MRLLCLVFKVILLLHMGADFLPKYFLVYQFYLPVVVWVLGSWYGQFDVCRPLHHLLDMASHLLFCPNKVINIFGGLGELIGSLPQICQVVDVGEAILVIYTIPLPLKSIARRSGSSLVNTLVLIPASAESLVSSAVSLDGASVGSQSAWGQCWWWYVPFASPIFRPDLLWAHPGVGRGIICCLCHLWVQLGSFPIIGVSCGSFGVGTPLHAQSSPVSLVGSLSVIVSRRCCVQAWPASTWLLVSLAGLVGFCIHPRPSGILDGLVSVPVCVSWNVLGLPSVRSRTVAQSIIFLYINYF